MSDSRCNPFTLTILVRKEVMYLNVHRWKYPKVCWYYLLPVSGRLWMWADECTKVACQWARPHMLPFIAWCFRNCNHQLGHFQVGVNLLSPVKTNPSGCTQNHNKEPSGPWSQLQLSKACHDPGCCCRHAHLQEKLPFQHVSHLRWKAQWDPLLPPPPEHPAFSFSSRHLFIFLLTATAAAPPLTADCRGGVFFPGWCFSRYFAVAQFACKRYTNDRKKTCSSIWGYLYRDI